MPELNSRLVAIDEPGGNRNLNMKINAQQNKANKAMSTNFVFNIHVLLHLVTSSELV